MWRRARCTRGSGNAEVRLERRNGGEGATCDDEECYKGSTQLFQTEMRSWILNWLVSTVSLLVAAWVIPGIRLSGPGAALAAALLIGFLNATVGLVLKILTIPLTIVTFGLFLLVVNALVFWLAAAIVPGFAVRGFWAAFFGALLMSIVGVILRHVVIG